MGLDRFEGDRGVSPMDSSAWQRLGQLMPTSLYAHECTSETPRGHSPETHCGPGPGDAKSDPDQRAQEPPKAARAARSRTDTFHVDVKILES